MAWDTGGWKLNEDNADCHPLLAPAIRVPCWIDNFVIPFQGQADDAAMPGIHFVDENRKSRR